MRTHERVKGLVRAPLLAWDILARGRYRFVYDQMPVRLHGMHWRKRCNLFKSGANLLHRRLLPWSMPLHMQFELTNYCNLRCPVCPTGAHLVNRSRQWMPVDLFERIIDQVGPYLLTASLWAWGEPNLHPQLKAVLRAARRHPFATLLSTNGQNLDSDRVIDALIEEPPAYLIVAIDGLTDETNSKFRVGARLAPALAGVRRLARLKRLRNQKLPVLHMRFIVMRHNQHQVPDLVDFARSHHFDMLSVRTLSIIDTEAPDENHASLIPHDSAHCAYRYDDDTRIERDDFYCLEPFWFPTVFADGSLVACEQDYNARQVMGSLAGTASFTQVWRSRRAQEVRRRIRDHADTIRFCRNCPYRDRETTDCSVRAYSIDTEPANGNMTCAEPLRDREALIAER